MTKRNHSGQDRRVFLKKTGFIFAGYAGEAFAWADASVPMGLELFTVRDLIAKDMEGTLAKVAQIGYKEVEPTTYGGLDAKQFRTVLDRFGLTAPSTHAGATDGPDVEKQLEAFQVMGIKYTEIQPARVSVRGGGGTPQRPPVTEESVKRTARQVNKRGDIAKRFGMKILIHNHANEFAPLGVGTLRPYDILLAETDPALVAMQLDIGWASVAGQNVIEMFRRNPGRYELWHVKDATAIKAMDPKLSMTERMRVAKLVPVGQGEIDYKSIFANAGLAGMKHFAIEQDNAPDSGDSLGAAQASYRGLKRMLS
ncbi:MAG: sugar phosphate isomerase/epimerase family protein [Bryobacteraceae bacterium]